MKILRCILYVVMMFLACSCHEWETYSEIPHIEFLEYQLLIDADSVPQKGVIVFSFTDGDGDIGLKENETEPPYDYNLFIEYLELHDGEWKHHVNEMGDTVNFNSRIPVITPAGDDKNILGTIYDTVSLNKYSPVDTFKYIIYIKDRALNVSNSIETPPILINL